MNQQSDNYLDTHRYLGVPPRIFRDFLQVVSKGRFYDGVIKGKFTERRRA